MRNEIDWEVVQRGLDGFAASWALAVQRVMEASKALVALFDPEGVWWQRRRRLRDERADQVRQTLGFEDDAPLPAWVRRLHADQVESFGTGNGRGENWIERGLPRVSELPLPAAWPWSRVGPHAYGDGESADPPPR